MSLTDGLICLGVVIAAAFVTALVIIAFTSDASSED